ncbi:capping protein inhibiting regulator of actin dynamics-like [Clytia hemisphaerica]|uniref:Uncharacterized protein n=1 Tax=Clytia hemisphaerica TaxID=252671 RepID=A0A7M5V9E1_9CNID
MNAISIVLLACYFGLLNCSPYLSTKRHFSKRRLKTISNHITVENVDPYFNKFKYKRSRNGADVGNFANDLAGDMFGIHPQDSVRLMPDERNGPIGKATENFVDPFNDMVDEPQLNQYAYKPQPKDYRLDNNVVKEAFQTEPKSYKVPLGPAEDEMKEAYQPEPKEIRVPLGPTGDEVYYTTKDSVGTQNQPSADRSMSASDIFHEQVSLQEPRNSENKGNVQKRKTSMNKGKKSASKKNPKPSVNEIKKLLQATDKDTEKGQEKGKMLKYIKKKHKKETKKKKKKVDNKQFAYLTLPDTQSVDITPMKPKQEEDDREEFTKAESDSTKTKIYAMTNNEGNKAHHEPESDQKSPQIEHKAPSEYAPTTEVDTTPPSENAEVVPSEVVEVKESPEDQQPRQGGDEMTTIVNTATASPTTSKITNNWIAVDSNNSTLNNQAMLKNEPKKETSAVKSETVSSALNEGSPASSPNSIHMLDQTKPAQAPLPPAPRPNKVIDIKEPDLNVSISFNTTDNQDRSVERLENVIKMVKGMKDGGAEPKPQQQPQPSALVNPNKLFLKEEMGETVGETKHVVEVDPLKSLLEAANMTNESQGAPEKDSSYVMHKGSLYKVTKVSPEEKSINNEPANSLAALKNEPSNSLEALDNQLSKLVTDTANRMSMSQPNDRLDDSVPKFSSTEVKKKGKDKKTEHLNIESFPLKDQKKTKKRPKGGKDKEAEEKVFGEGDTTSNEEDTEDKVDEEDVTKSVRNKHLRRKHPDADEKEGDEEQGEEGNRRHHRRLEHRKLRHRAGKKKHRLSNEDADLEEGEDEEDFGLEYHDEDEQENEKVPFPTTKKKEGGRKKKKKKFSDDEETNESTSEDNDEDSSMHPKKKKRKHRFDKEDNEEEDMSIHMLDKVKGHVTSDEENEGLGEERDKENGNKLQGMEDTIEDSHLEEGKSSKDDENFEEESVASVIQSKQKSKKLFGASLRRFKMAHQAAAPVTGRQRNMTFFVDDGGTDAIMKTKFPVKAGETIVMGENLSKTKLLEKSSLSEPTSPINSLAPGYTIKLFTNPEQHSRTYEIKHGNRFYTVVESDGGQGESKSSLVNHEVFENTGGPDPEPAAPVNTKPVDKQPLIAEPKQGASITNKTAETASVNKTNLTIPAHQSLTETKQQSAIVEPSLAKPDLSVALNSLNQKGKDVPIDDKKQHIVASVVQEEFKPQLSSTSENSGNIDKEKSGAPLQSGAKISSKTFDVMATESVSLTNSGLNRLSALKTIIPALIGTRKASLPVDPKITERKDSPTNTLSREIKGVTSLSPLKESKPMPSDDFDKTLNEHIVLK